MNDTPPEEFRHGWPVVAGTFLILTMGFGSAYSFGTFFAPLEDEFGASRAAVSVAFSAAILALFSVGPFSGTIADQLGPRMLVSGGLALVGCGLIIASVSQALWQVQAAFAVCIGGGVGLAYVPAVGAVQKWFDRRRGLASGIAVSGIGAGTLALPPFTALMIAELDWRPALLLVGSHCGSRWRSIRPAGHQPGATTSAFPGAGSISDRRTPLLCHPLPAFLPAVPRLPPGLLRAVHAHRPPRPLRRRPWHLATDGGGPAQPARRRQRRWPLHYRRGSRPHWTLAWPRPVLRRRRRELHPVAHRRQHGRPRYLRRPRWDPSGAARWLSLPR